MRIPGPEMDPLLSSLMWHTSFQCEMPQVELKSARTFLAIKHSQGTKSKNVIKQSQSSLKCWCIFAPLVVKLLKMNYKCQSGGMCVHLRFYMMWYVLSCKLRWWWVVGFSPLQLDLLDLSHCTRVYVWGRRWVSSWSGLCLIWSDTHLQIPTERSLDLSWLGYWLILRRNAGTVCGASTTYLVLTSAFFFDEEAKDPMMSVCHRPTPAIGILANHTTAMVYDNVGQKAFGNFQKFKKWNAGWTS